MIDSVAVFRLDLVENEIKLTKGPRLNAFLYLWGLHLGRYVKVDLLIEEILILLL